MTRGRPRKTNPEDALNAAMKLFWEKGYEGTSMSDLVSATGMAKPGIYATFGDKKTLYSKALSHYFYDLGVPFLDALVDAPVSLSQAIRNYMEAVIDASLDPICPSGCFVVNSLIENANQPPELIAMSKKFDEARRIAFKKRFERAALEGELPEGVDSLALSEFYAGQILAVAVMGRAGNDREALMRFVDVAMCILPKKLN